MLHGCEDVGGTGICSDRGGDQLREAAHWSRNRSSCHRSPSADLRRCPYISNSSISRTQGHQVFFDKHNEVKSQGKKYFRFDEFHDRLDLTKNSTRIKKYSPEEKGATISSDYQNLGHFNMTKDLGTLDSKQEHGINCGSDHKRQEQKNFDPRNLNKGTSPGRNGNNCDDNCLPWNAVDPLLDGRCQTTSDHPYWDPNFWIPRRPLARGRLYHFNVIYHHARTRLSRTADSDLALRVTTALVERLEMRGYVNSYYHDRDRRHENAMTCELERVLAESSVTILLLTPGFIDQCLSSYLNIPAFRQLVSGPHPNHRLLTLSVGVPSQRVPQLLLINEILYFQQDWQVDIPTWTRFDTAVMGFLQEQKELWMTQHREDMRYELGKHTRSDGAHDRNDNADFITKCELGYDIVDGVFSIRNGECSDNLFPRTKTEKQRKLDVDQSELLDPLSVLYNVEMSVPLEQIYDMPSLYKTSDEMCSLPSDFVHRPIHDFYQIFTRSTIDELGHFESFLPPDDSCQFAENDCQQYMWAENKLINILRDEYKDEDMISMERKTRALHDTEHDSLEMERHVTHETEKNTSPESHRAEQTLGKSQTTTRANQLLIDFSNKLFDRLTSKEMEDVIVIPELTNEDGACSEVAEDESEDEELSLICSRGHSLLHTTMKDEISWNETFQEISELTSVDIFHKPIPDMSSSFYMEYDGEFNHCDEPYSRKGIPHNIDNRTAILIAEHTDWVPYVTENRSLGELATVRDSGLVDMTGEDTEKWSREEYFYRDTSDKKEGNEYKRLDVTNKGGELPIMDSRGSRIFDITSKWDADKNSPIECTSSYNLTTEDTAVEKLARVCKDRWVTSHGAYITGAWGSCSLDKLNSNDDLGKENASGFLCDQNWEEHKAYEADSRNTSFNNDELSFEERLEKWAAYPADTQTASENTYLKTLDSTVSRTPLADLAVERCLLDTMPNARKSLLQQWDDDTRARKTEQDSLYTGQHPDSSLTDFLREMTDYLTCDQSIENGKMSDLDVHQSHELDLSVAETDRQTGDGGARLEICPSRYKYRESDLLRGSIPYVQDRDIQDTEGNDTTLSSNQPITAEVRQSLTEKSTASDTEVLFHGKQPDYVHEDRASFLNTTDQPSQKEILQRENESFLDSHILDISTMIQTTRELTSSHHSARNMAKNEIISFSTIETEKDDRSGTGDDSIDRISSSDVLQTVRDSTEPRKDNEQVNGVEICENKDTTNGLFGGSEIDDGNEEFAQEENSSNVDRHTTLNFIQTLSESVKEVQETTENPTDSTDGSCIAAMGLGIENEMSKVLTTQTEAEDLVATLADIEEVKSESTTSGNNNEEVKSEGKTSSDNEEVKSESASLGDVQEMKSKDKTLGNIEEVKSEEKTLGDTEKVKSEGTTLGDTEEVKSERTTLGDIQEVKSEIMTVGNTQRVRSNSTSLGNIDAVKSEEKSEEKTLGDIEEVKSEAATLGDSEKVKSESTTLGDFKEVKSNCTILGDIEKVKSESMTLSKKIEEVKCGGKAVCDTEEMKLVGQTSDDNEDVKSKGATSTDNKEVKSENKTLSDNNDEVKLESTVFDNIEGMKSEYQQTDRSNEICNVEQLCGKTVVSLTEENESIRHHDLSCIYDQSPEARIGGGFNATSVAGASNVNEKFIEGQLDECREKISNEIVEPCQDNTEEQRESSIAGKSWQLQNFSEASEGQKHSREDALSHNVNLLSKRHSDSIVFRASKSTDVDSSITTTENHDFNINVAEKIVKSDSVSGNDRRQISETIADHSMITLISDEDDVSLHNQCRVSGSLRNNTEKSLPESSALNRDEVYSEKSQFGSSTEPFQNESRGNTTNMSHSAMTGTNRDEGEGSPFEPQSGSTTEYDIAGVSNREQTRLSGVEENTEHQRSSSIDCNGKSPYKRRKGDDSEHGVCPGKTDRNSDAGNNVPRPIMTSFISNIESLQQQSGVVNIVAQNIVHEIKIRDGQEEVTNVVNTTSGQEIHSNVLARSEIESYSIEQQVFQSDKQETSQHESWVNIISNVPAISHPIKDDKSSNISNVLQILKENVHSQDVTAHTSDNIVAIHIALEMNNKDSSRQKKITLDSPASVWRTDEMNEITVTTQGGGVWPEKNHEDISSTTIISKSDTNGESACVIPASSSETISVILPQLSSQVDILSYVTNTKTTAKSSKPFQQSVMEALNASYATLGEEEDHVFFAGAVAESLPQIQHNDEFISLLAGAESVSSPRGATVHDRDNAGISSSPRNPMGHNDAIGDAFSSPRGLMYQEGDSGYFGEKPDSLSHMDENQVAGTEQTERSANMHRPVEYNILYREGDETEVNESGPSNNPITHSAGHADFLNLQTGIRNSDPSLPSAPGVASVLWDETAPGIRQTPELTEKGSQGEGTSSMRQQSSDFRFYTYRADCVTTEGSFFSGHADLVQRDTLTWQPAANEDARDQSEASLSAGDQETGDDGRRSENEYRVTHETILSTGSQGPGTDQGAATEATLSGAEGSSSENAEPKEKANWWLEIYKGVCHTLAKPDMPYMG